MYHSDCLITRDVFYILFCRIKSGGNLCQIDHDILHLGIVIQDYLVGFTSNAGLLISAKGGSLRDCIIGIYPHAACFHASCHAQGTIDISGPYSTAQSVLTVICHGNDLFLCLKLQDAGHRSENFLLSHSHVVGNIT